MSELLFKKPDGSFVTVDSSEAEVAKQAGYVPATREDALASRKPASAFLEGAARGVTFGLSDPLLIAAGTDREQLKARKEQNPKASMAGEIGGAVGFGVATGGASGLVGGGIKGAAFEGGLYGTGAMISESALDNKELTGEHLAAGFVGGALAGGAAQGLFSAAGKGVSLGLSKFGGQGLKGALNEAAFKAEERALSEGFATGVNKLRKRGGEMRDVVEYAKREGLPIEFNPETADKVKAALKKTGDETADRVRILDGVKPLTDDANRLSLVDGAIKTLQTKFKGDIAAEADVARFISDELEPLLGRTDLTWPEVYKLQSRLRAKVENVTTGMKREVYDTGRKTLRDAVFAETEALGEGVQKQMHALQKDYATGSFLSEAIQNRINKNAASGGVTGTGMMDILRGGGLGGAAGAAVLGPVGAPIGALLGAYANRALKEKGASVAAGALRSLAESRVTGGISRGLAGHLNTILATAPEVLGAYRYPLAIAAAQGADALMEEHLRLAAGPQGQDYMSKAALTVESPEEVKAAGERLAVLDALQAQAEQQQLEIDRAVDGVFGTAPGRKGAFSTTPMTHKDFKKTMESIEAMLRSPEKAFEQVPGNLRAGAPGMSSEAAAKLLFVAQFLDSKAPKAPDAGMPVALASPWQPSAADLDRFNRYKEAVESPAKVLKNMANGYIAREQVEAIQAVYPAIYQDLKEKISERMMTYKKPLTFQQKQAFSAILGVPLGMSQTQMQILQGLQQQVTQPPQGGSVKQDGRQKVDQEKNMETQAQRLERR